MEQNKTGKYLKYAIGEIALVTIGILLAVYINNWNNNRKSEVLKQELFLELLDELQYNIDRIKFLDTNTVRVYSFKFTDSLLRRKLLSLRGGLDTNEVRQLMYGFTFKFNSFNLISDVYEQLKESKIINNLDKDEQLAIKSYYKLIEREELFNVQTFPRIIKAMDDCKYGYQELRDDYNEDSSSYLKNHSWVFEKSSKHYIDLKNMLQVTYSSMHRSRQRMMGIIDESEKLKILLTTPKTELILK